MKRFKQSPSPLPSPAEWRGCIRRNFLKVPLTFILSRKRREEMKENFLKSPHPTPSSEVKRGD